MAARSIATAAVSLQLLTCGVALGGPLQGIFHLANADAIFQGEQWHDQMGTAISSAGDVNGDGLADVLIGIYKAGHNGPALSYGSTYLFYGSAGQQTLAGAISVGSANVEFVGEHFSDGAGQAVADAGDVNGDGLGDILIGAPWVDTFSEGKAYLVYGRGVDNALPSEVDLGSADFEFYGIGSNYQAGGSVASAGDFNGDNIDDLLIGAPTASPLNQSEAGRTHVKFGGTGVDELSGSTFVADVYLNGAEPDDRAGRSIASAGDVNGDGFDDVIVGARSADPHDVFAAGEAYLIYGRADSSSGSTHITLSDADVVFEGFVQGGLAGGAVSSAGDFNGDGLDDVLISAYLAGESPSSSEGETYLFYGKGGQQILSGTLSLATADAVFSGKRSIDHAGVSVSSAGDVNGDGVDDILIGATNAHHVSSGPAIGPSGETYLIYGRTGEDAITGSVSLLQADVTFRGNSGSTDIGAAVASAGDVNGDGLDDLLIGAPGDNISSGSVYLVYGRAGAVPDVLHGDFNFDGHVSGADFLTWQRGLGTDFNTDDCALWQENYGASAVAVTSIPEARTVMLVWIVCVVLAGSSHRSMSRRLVRLGS